MNWKLIVGIVLSLLLLYGIMAKIVESNFACRLCHKPQYLTWAKSTHQKINCRDCHIEPGVAGVLKARINGLGNLAVYITRGTQIQPHDDPLPISTENCRGCHGAILYVNEIGFEDLPNNSLKGQSLIVAHRVHVEKYQIECVECHRGIVHRDPDEIGKYTTNFPFMHKDCGVCHDGKYRDRFQIEVTDLEDKGKCTTCHPTYQPPPDF